MKVRAYCPARRRSTKRVLLSTVELEMQVKKIRNENSVLLQEAVEPYYIRYIVAKD